MPESVSLAAERAADSLRSYLSDSNVDLRWLTDEIQALDDARVLLQAYEVTEQEIRDQVAGTVHEQPGEGPAYLMAVFESMRVASAKGTT